MTKYLFASLVIVLAGCATQSVNQEVAINRALKICGVGIESTTGDAFKVAVGIDKGGHVAISKEASENVNTQIAVLLKQAELKSEPSLKIAAEEMRLTRDCVLQQLNMQKTVSRADLLEQCRQDALLKIAPYSVGNPFRYNTITLWNQESRKLSTGDIVRMDGFFDSGGKSSFNFKAVCDLRGGRFNESVIESS